MIFSMKWKNRWSEKQLLGRGRLAVKDNIYIL